MMTLMNMDIDAEVEISVQTDANNMQRLVIEPVRQVTLETIMSQVTPENMHGEMDFGDAQGQEIW